MGGVGWDSNERLIDVENGGLGGGCRGNYDNCGESFSWMGECKLIKFTDTDDGGFIQTTSSAAEPGAHPNAAAGDGCTNFHYNLEGDVAALRIRTGYATTA